MAFIEGKLTVTTANPSISVDLPIHAIGDMPRAEEEHLLGTNSKENLSIRSK